MFCEIDSHSSCTFFLDPFILKQATDAACTVVFRPSVRIATEEGRANWFPVGSVCVERSGRVNETIFANEAALLQGAFRLFPRLEEHRHELEYGYQLKEFPDEEVRVAQRPVDKKKNPLIGFFEKIMGDPMNVDNLGR